MVTDVTGSAEDTSCSAGVDESAVFGNRPNRYLFGDGTYQLFLGFFCLHRVIGVLKQSHASLKGSFLPGI